MRYIITKVLQMRRMLVTSHKPLTFDDKLPHLGLALGGIGATSAEEPDLLNCAKRAFLVVATFRVGIRRGIFPTFGLLV